MGPNTNNAPQKSRHWFPAKGTDARAAIYFLGPYLVIYALFLVYPLFKGFWISLHDWELVGNYRKFIGFYNYRDLWQDRDFLQAMRNTLLFVALSVPAMTVLALTLALALHRPTRTNGILRSIFFGTSILSVTVVTLIWKMVLNGDRGLMANLFESIGLDPVNFLGSAFWAMPSLVVTTFWWGVGLPMALILASLGQVPSELYEAAELDHASRFSVLRRITLPAIRNTMVLVIVFEIVLQFQIFGQAYLMTQGGPAGRTRTLVQFIYETGFRDWQVGYASAAAMVLFGVMLLFSMLQLWLSRQEGT